MAKLKVVHQMADCMDCDWHNHDYRKQNARKAGYQHHKKTGHEVHVETGSSITYERSAAPLSLHAEPKE